MALFNINDCNHFDNFNTSNERIKEEMRINDLPLIMVRCLILTIIIEVVISLLFKVKNKKDLLNVVLVNVLTNPLVVSLPIFMLFRYGLLAKYISLAVLEILAVIVEGLIYSKVLEYRKINPYLLSLILNSCSYLIGVFMDFVL